MTPAAGLLPKLKRRLGITGTAKDALLMDLIEDAQTFALSYTGLRDLPASEDGAVTELASVAYNRLGAEGESAHSEGGVSATMYGGLPPLLKARLDRLRTAKVG